ncbi:MAG: PA14 domain-containing protein [Bacteroidota bacterium]
MLAVKFLRAVLFLTLGILLPIFIIAQTSISFSFSLPAAASTSAGVFTKSGTLIKTLWSGVNYSAGSHTVNWDGTKDDGSLAPVSSYDIRVLSNNVKYNWDGVIGNTSDAVSGPTVQRFFERIYGMAVSGTSAYFSTGYNEGSPSQAKFLTSNPQVKIDVLNSSGSGTGQSTLFLTTDGTNVYYGGSDAFSSGNSKWFVYGTKTADDGETSFSNGTNYSCVYGPTYHSAIDVITDASANISGMAVQKTGNYLFVSHKNLNRIDVLDKTTGALAQTLSFTAPGGLTVDNNNNLWIIYTLGGNRVVNKFSVQSNGTLSAATLNLPGLLDPLAMAVSPDGNTLVVADGSTSQQLKAFDDASGSASWTFGQLGGYITDPNVTNDKFYFSDLSGGIHETFIAFQPDGSFWVGDIGNYRTLHFAANRTYLDRMMFLRHNYSIAVDPNNPSRVFAEYLEFKIDYSKPLAANNGSWTLVKNWRAAVPAAYYQEFMINILKFTTTLSNGRTYGLLQNLSTSKFEVVELPASGPIRFTGIATNAAIQILPDGSLGRYAIAGLNQLAYWQKFPLQGFDGSNNPIWAMNGGGDTLATMPKVGGTDPVDWGSYPMAGAVTSSGIVVSFDKDVIMLGHGFGYHLGGIRAGDNKFLWQTAKSTNINYAGEFPADGGFDVGNTVQYPGGVALAIDRNIFWGYHGEFWKNSQVNKWNQVWDDGLFIGQFGVTGPEVAGQIAAPMMAGNVFSANVVKDANGDVYLYHNDESHHSAMHRWKVTGLNTIQEQTVPVMVVPTGSGLLGFYYDDVVLNNFDLKKIRIDPNVNNNTVPIEIQNQGAYSTRWKGYVLPSYSETYTFYANTNKSVRLWVNDQLIINNWTNTSQNESSGTINLTAGGSYKIRLDMNGTNGTLSWSSASQSKQIIPSSYLVPVAAPDTSNGIDLMEGLLFNNVLENNVFGWSRNTVNEDYTGPAYMQWWSVKSGIKAYDVSKSPDIAANYAQNAGVYTINRDLGNGVLNAWKISGVINYEGTNANSSAGQGGVYFEVLDAFGKVITRFYNTLYWSGGSAYLSVSANNTILASDIASNIGPTIVQAQPISISLANGVATFTYANFPPVTTSILDPSANWEIPKTMRLYFWTSGSNYSRSVDLQSMRFFSNNPIVTTLLPLRFISVNANRDGRNMEVAWSTVNEINTGSFQIERSNDGVLFKSVGTLASNNLPGTQKYNFVDAAPVEGTAYYRIKATDKDGKYLYSPVISAGRTDIKFSFYPNPVQNSLEVHYPPITEAGSLEIISAGGVKLKSVVLKAGTANSSVDVGFLFPGFYLLRFNNGSSVTTNPFVKQ